MSEPSSSSVRSGFATAGLAAVGGLLMAGGLTALAGVDDPTTIPGTALRGWLIAHGSGLTAGELVVTAVPIGGALLAVLLVATAARAVLHRAPRPDPRAYVATVAGAYGLMAALCSTVTTTETTSTSLLRSAAGAFLVGAAGAVMATPDWASTVFDRRPRVLALLRAGLIGVWTLLGIAGVLLAGLLVLGVETAAERWASLDPGLAGAPALALLCLIAVPTLVVWTVAVLVGPGIGLGAGASVDLATSTLGALPGFPPLAVLPEGPDLPGWLVVLGVLPFLAGGVTGSSLPEESDDSVLVRAAWGLAAGTLAGLIVGGLVAVSGGAMGPGRMSDVGPEPVATALLAVGQLGVGGAVGSVLAHYRGAGDPDRRPRQRRGEQPAGVDRRGG